MKNLLIVFLLIPFFVSAQTKIIHVSNADEFVNAIGSDRTIILSGDTFRLRDIVKLKNVPIDTEGCNDMPICANVIYSNARGVSITGVSNLTILGDTSSKIHSLLSTRDEDDQILTFEDCKNIRMKNVDAVHLIPVLTSCSGGVLFFIDCKNVMLSNCTLSGCGEYGMLCDNDTNMTCYKCRIEHCSEYLFELNNNQHLLFQSCIFTDIKVMSSMIELTDCTDLHFVKCEFSKNVTPSNSDYYRKEKNCVFDFYEDKKGKDILLEDCTFSDNEIFLMTNRNDLLTRTNVKYLNNDNLKK
jgi:hypothetical protein